jgi:peptidyl-prolyl cis-trans isomerase C
MKEDKMELRKIMFTLAILGLFASLALAQEEDPVLGKAGDFIFRKSDFDRIISYTPAERQKYFTTNPQQKTVILKRIVEHRAIADLAKKEGFDKKTEVKEQLEFLLNDYLAQEYLKKVVLKDIVITEEEIKKHYQENEKTYIYPAQAKARHILIKVAPNAPEEEKKKAKEKAEGLLKKVKDGEDFAKLAGEFSEDQATQKKGGDLGYFSKGRMVKPFEDAAFALKPGQVSEIVESQFGFHIIKLEDLKEARVRSFEEVKEMVKSQIQLKRNKEKQEEFLKNIYKEAGVEIHPEKLQEQKK